MARFAFRLQKVLEHRRREVDGAKLAVGRAAELLADVERRLVALVAGAAKAVDACAGSVDDRLNLQAHLETVDAEARALELERKCCEEDLIRAQQELGARKADLSAIEVLEEKDRQAWIYEEARREQNELDEWATMRRPSGAA